MPKKSHMDPKEGYINEDTEEEPITVDSKRTLSLRTLRRFRTLNDFCAEKVSFGFLLMVCDRVGDGDKFSYENFGLERPTLHATVT